MPDAIGAEIVAARPAFRARTARADDDASLVARVRVGDDAAFEAIFDRYHRNLLAFCQHMLGSREEAEDALQHIFMAAHDALRADDRPCHLRPWLYTIARNRCLSTLRTRRQHTTLDGRDPTTEGLLAEVDRRAELEALVRDLRRLPEDQRAALVLRELDDQSHDEIAIVLGVRRDKVKALIFQARESLMGWRVARETPCGEIREELATGTGAQLRCGRLRRHVDQCVGCAEYAREVRRQRAALAVVLPVVPASGLKPSILGSVVGGSSATVTAVGGGTSMSVGAAAVLGVKGAAMKILATVLVAGGVGGTGYIAVDRVELGGAEQPAGLHAATAARSPERSAARSPAGATGSTPAVAAPGVGSRPGATPPDAGHAPATTVSGAPADVPAALPTSTAPGDAMAPPVMGESTTQGAEVPQGIGIDGSTGEAADEPNGKATDEPKGKGADEPKGKAADEPKGKATDKPKGKGADEPKGKGADEPKGKAADEPKDEAADVPRAERPRPSGVKDPDDSAAKKRPDEPRERKLPHRQVEASAVATGATATESAARPTVEGDPAAAEDALQPAAPDSPTSTTEALPPQ
jgi:RNA polymerase sigma factor (sigma-70 family)